MTFSLKIAERLRPFSHTPGVTVPVPRTRCVARVYPNHLKLLMGGNAIEFPFEFTGPVNDFTVSLDLEKGGIIISGHAKEGFFRFLLVCEQGQVVCISKTERRVLPEIEGEVISPPSARLSLGNHRAQDWDLISRRGDLKEIFPAWLRLAEWIPHDTLPSSEGNYRLVQEAKGLIENKDKSRLSAAFRSLFAASFQGLLSPQVEDPNYLGLSSTGTPALCPFPLLTESGRLIRSLFFRQEGAALTFLPLLLPEFHCGRYLGLSTIAGDRVDFEWTKKRLRRLILTPAREQTLTLKLQPEIKSFRLRRSRKERGATVIVDAPLALHPGQPLYLDNFR